MQAADRRIVPGCFPRPSAASKDRPAQTLRESLLLVREKAGLPKVGFHDLRHFFASQCVMAGMDFMTIASWLGHSDGGIFVGKVYGHLADTHKKSGGKEIAVFHGGKEMKAYQARSLDEWKTGGSYPHFPGGAARLRRLYSRVRYCLANGCDTRV